MLIKKLIVLLLFILNISHCFSNTILQNTCKEVWTTVNNVNNIETYKISLLMCTKLKYNTITIYGSTY